MFICGTLNRQRQGGFITSRGYRNAKYGTPSARSIRDRDLVAKTCQIHAANYGVYGVRKMWHALTRCGLQIGREQTARLMRLAGVSGKGEGTLPTHDTQSEAGRYQSGFGSSRFSCPGPNRLWIADITYVRTRAGFVYAAFVTDVFSRKIVSWALSDSMCTEALPLQALNQAITSAKETNELVHHSDHGSQYVSIVYNDRLTDAGITPWTGSVGDSYDNALAENVNGSNKNELINIH